MTTQYISGAGGIASEGQVGTGSVTQRLPFSRVHIFGAKTQRDEAIRTEAPTVASLDEHRSHVVLAIISAACFLEAIAHEVVLDAHEKGHTYPSMAGLSEALVKAVAALESKLNDELGSSLGLFNRILVAAGRQPFDIATQPHLGAEHLFWLRNALVHARPADTATSPIGTNHKRPKQTVEALRAYAFALNPRFSAESSNAEWPDRFIGAGCARWAVDTAETFAQAFVARLGVALWW